MWKCTHLKCTQKCNLCNFHTALWWITYFLPWSFFSTDPTSQSYHNFIATSSWALFFSATSSDHNSQNPLCYVHLVEPPSFPSYFISKKDVLFSFFPKLLLYRTDSHMYAFTNIIILTFSCLELGLSQS